MEIMVAVGLVGVLGIFMAQLMKDTSKDSLRIMQDSIIREETSRIEKIVTRPYNCKLNFVDSATNVLGFPKKINSLQRKTSTGTRKFIDIPAPAPAKNPGHRIGLGRSSVGIIEMELGNYAKISDLEGSFGKKEVGTFTLMIKYLRSGVGEVQGIFELESGKSNKELTRYIKFRVTVDDTGKIIDCTDRGRYQEDACRAMQGVWDPATQKCEVTKLCHFDEKLGKEVCMTDWTERMGYRKIDCKWEARCTEGVAVGYRTSDDKVKCCVYKMWFGGQYE